MLFLGLFCSFIGLFDAGWGTVTWKRGQRLMPGTSAMEEGRKRPKVYKAHLCYHHMALGAARVVVVVKEQANVLERCARLVSSLLGLHIYTYIYTDVYLYIYAYIYIYIYIQTKIYIYIYIYI